MKKNENRLERIETRQEKVETTGCLL